MSLYRLIPGAVAAAVLAMSGCGEYGGASTGADDAGKSPTVAAKGEAPASSLVADTTPAEPKAAPKPKPQREKLTLNEMIEKYPDPRGVEAAERPTAQKEADGPTTTNAMSSTVRLDPAELDLGTVPANDYASGVVKLVNTGDEPVIVTDCKTSCGCTTANCPKNQEIQPGASAEVEIRMTAGSRARRISKTVTFVVENQPILKLPVTVSVETFVTIEPAAIDPEKKPDGRVVLVSTDNQPFRITRVIPAIVEPDGDPLVEHELYLNWEKWRELGQARRITFSLDHPKATQVSMAVSARPPKRDVNPLVSGDVSPRDAVNRGDQPLDVLTPDAKIAVAIKRGDVDTIKEALERESTDPAMRDSMLSMAARYGQVKVIKTLLDGGANVEVKDKRGRTPLMLAVQSRNPEAVSVLIEEGANVNSKDQAEGTALFGASGPFGNEAVVAELLDAGAQVNVYDKNGMTPLMWAVRFGDVQRVDALLKAGATVDAHDSRGLSAIDYARTRRDKESADRMIQLLQQHS